MLLETLRQEFLLVHRSSGHGRPVTVLRRDVSDVRDICDVSKD
jgi:hypothetical protein